MRDLQGSGKVVATSHSISMSVIQWSTYPCLGTLDIFTKMFKTNVVKNLTLCAVILQLKQRPCFHDCNKSCQIVM